MWTEQDRTRWHRNAQAMVRSAGNDDPEAFADLVELADWLNREGLPQAYAALRANGYSTREIGRPLPVTAQAAWARFANK
jgi:hypothetical protein